MCASAVYSAMLADFRYALRSLRRSPLFAMSVTATIGIGLGVLCSGFTILNAYILKPIDLPEPHTLYELSWDTTTVRRHRFTLDDYNVVRLEKKGFVPYSRVLEAAMGQAFAVTATLLPVPPRVTGAPSEHPAERGSDR